MHWFEVSSEAELECMSCLHVYFKNYKDHSIMICVEVRHDSSNSFSLHVPEVSGSPNL